MSATMTRPAPAVAAADAAVIAADVSPLGTPITKQHTASLPATTSDLDEFVVHVDYGDTISGHVRWLPLEDEIICELPSSREEYFAYINATEGTGYNLWLWYRADNDNFRFDSVSRNLLGFGLKVGDQTNEPPSCFATLLSLSGRTGSFMLVGEDVTQAELGNDILPCGPGKASYHSLADDALFCFDAAATSRLAETGLSGVTRLYLAPHLSLFLNNNRYFAWVLENCSQQIMIGPWDKSFAAIETATLLCLWQFRWIISEYNEEVSDRQEALRTLNETLTATPVKDSLFKEALSEVITYW